MQEQRVKKESKSSFFSWRTEFRLSAEFVKFAVRSILRSEEAI